MKLIIDIDENLYNFVNTKRPNGYYNNFDEFDCYDISECMRNGTPLSDNATNGDVIKSLFPHIEIKDNCDMYYSVDIENLSIDKSLNTVGFKKDWWNAPYKEKKQ